MPIKLRLYLQFTKVRKAGSNACYMCALEPGAHKIDINQEKWVFSSEYFHRLN